MGKNEWFYKTSGESLKKNIYEVGDGNQGFSFISGSIELFSVYFLQ